MNSYVGSAESLKYRLTAALKMLATSVQLVLTMDPAHVNRDQVDQDQRALLPDRTLGERLPHFAVAALQEKDARPKETPCKAISRTANQADYLVR